MSVAINIENVVKRFGKDTIINGLSLNIKEGEFFTLLGPSGCGKTTLLRMIIGFNSIEGGEIKLDEKLINNIPTNKRNMGMVFQNYAIFPHMSVKDNVAFGLKRQKMSKKEIDEKVDEILKIVKIDHLKDRMPVKLSGGQQQRVALARAIVIHPEVLLMDEPLSNLDAKLRVEMRNAIKRIQQQIGITTVYVTHDQEEALAVSDRIAVMNGGVIQQIDTPKRIYQRPSNTFVATFIGQSNILDGQVIKNNSEEGIKIFDAFFAMTNLSKNCTNMEDVKVSIRPEEFILSMDNKDGIKGVVKSSVFLGINTNYFIELENGKEIEVIQASDALEAIPNDSTVYLKLQTEKINVFNNEGTNSLIEGV
ncbi:TOBE domain protein [Lachnoanaerobaculum sp. ICM7]|jgi:ABC transporter related protein|uniref:ABC transporter ATP-binding protein n=1 Tax=Lachnoanaerobaculum sp. ICM7 TaxID=936594 RepID=UPI00027A6C6E|nr:ABC transporter ATP-binding protein [Lachnoanaerobaculum sp. ICM7]EJP18353.1 TOBE domain protein [Lachnoanaerobaculum sp. ICM7]